MRWDFGAVLKQIRQSKGLSQHQVCGNQLSRVALSNIENGKSIPNVENMEFLLRQMDMTMDEFHYICDLYQPQQRQQIIKKIRNILAAPTPKQVDQISLLCQHYLQTTDDLTIQRLWDSVKVYEALSKDDTPGQSPDSQHLAKEIWRYLEKADTWYESELRMLHAILYLFPIDHIDKIINKILDSSKRYRYYHNIRSFQLTLYTNLASLYFYHNRPTETLTFSRLAFDLAKEEKRYDILAMSQIRIGLISSDQRLIDEGMTILQLTHEKHLISSLSKEIAAYHP